MSRRPTARARRRGVGALLAAGLTVPTAIALTTAPAAAALAAVTPATAPAILPAASYATGGAIGELYSQLTASGQAIGTPTSPELAAGGSGGRMQHFTGGDIYWSPATPAAWVHGGVASELAALGGVTGMLGFPTGQESAAKSPGRYQNFQGGSILWSPATGAHVVRAAIAGEFASQGYEYGTLGFPTSDETVIPGGVVQRYQGGSVWWSAGTGAATTLGAIGSRYEGIGGPGALGFPTGDEAAAKTPGRYQTFQRAVILWSPTTGAWETLGGIRSAWAAQGFERGSAGFPAGPEYSVAGGRAQQFQGRLMTWNVNVPAAPGTDVTPVESTQVMVAHYTGGTYGTWARYDWNGSSWVQVASPATSVFGSAGIAWGASRVMGSNTTPTGSFRILSTFGMGNPGTAMPYRTIDGCSVWVEDTNAADFNRWREDCGTVPDSEKLINYGVHYQQAGVVDFNYANPQRSGPGSGAGIFLHYAQYFTEGCVAVNNLSELTATLRWMNPSRNPMVVIS